MRISKQLYIARAINTWNNWDSKTVMYSQHLLVQIVQPSPPPHTHSFLQSAESFNIQENHREPRVKAQGLTFLPRNRMVPWHFPRTENLTPFGTRPHRPPLITSLGIMKHRA